MAIKSKKTIIGKHALILIVRGEKELASQVFVYDQIREVRANLETMEVKVLMSYDEAYFRVFSLPVEKDWSEAEIKKNQENILKFYNNLLNAASKFSHEELTTMAKQQNQRLINNKKGKKD
ncbi:MAG: hypothetical protein GQ557_00285 [Mycoplasmataceae bacterium]|nr:hypothetical protein [Mycoplasmataceae bacterium]